MSRTTMKAVRKTTAGPGLDLVEIDIPDIKPDEVLLRVKATAICGTDLHFYNWDAFAQAKLKPPITLGHEFAGEVVAVGHDVIDVMVGDYVASDSHISCGRCQVCKLGLQHICQNLKIFGNEVDGSFAEFVAVPENSLWKLSPDVPPEIGAIMEPLGGAVQTVLIEPVTSQSVAIFGDGPIALFAIGVARAAGASQVIHIGKYPARIDIGRQMGADASLSIRDEIDPVTFIHERTRGVGADVTLEMAGSPTSIQQAFDSVRKGGRVSMFGLTSEPIKEFDFNFAITLRQVRVLGVAGRHMWDTWRQMDGLLQSGTLDPTPVITHTLPLEQYERGFQEAMSEERTVGKVVLLP